MPKIDCKNQNKAFSLIEISIVILIIGILIAGVASGSRLIAKSKLATAQNLTLKSPVNDIDNLTLWLETTLDGAVINTSDSKAVKDGDQIKKWNDINPQSGVKNNAMESLSIGTRPTFKKNAINNLPALYFNNNALQIFAPRGLNSANVTSFYVVKEEDITSWVYPVFYWASAPPDRGFYFMRDNTSGWRLFYTSCTSGSCVSNIYYGSTTLDNKPKILTVAVGSGKASSYKNSIQIASNSSGDLNPQILTDKFIIGKYYDSGTSSMGSGAKLYIAEIIYYSRALDDDERQDVEKYLSKKWKINLN